MNVEEFLNQNKRHPIESIRYPIEKIKAYESYVMVYLNDEKIMVSDDLYFEYGLKNLKGLDEQTYQKLKEEEIVFKAYRGCLRKISMKDHSIRQISEFLSQKGINRPDREKIIDKLMKIGLLDDEKYCIGRIAYLQRSDLSEKQIREKLKKAGIADEIIRRNLKTDHDDESRKARLLAEKYDKSIRNKSKNLKRQNILSRLMNAGYSYDMSMDAVESLSTDDQNELELLNREYLKARKKFEKKYQDHELRNHICAYLLNKGFRYEEIKQITEVEDGQTG